MADINRDDNNMGAVVDSDANYNEMRIDLHLHSVASGAATNWWVKGLGLGVESRESSTLPEDAYGMVKEAGMDFATLTDHETIDGALTLVANPDFLVGVEVGTVFPEDGSKADVLVYGLNMDQHLELQARRPNIYKLVDYLREEGLFHILAHPIFEVGAPMNREGIEKRIALFGHWEFINGSRPDAQNLLTQEIAQSIGASEIRQLARKYELPIPPHQFIAGTAGSDDHGGVYPGKTWTVVPHCTSVDDLLSAMKAGETRPGGEHGSVARMTSTGFRITVDALASRVTSADDAPVEEPKKPLIPANSPLMRLLPSQSMDIEKLLEFAPLLMGVEGANLREVLTSQYARKVSDALGSAEQGFSPLRVLTSLGSFVDAHLYITPFLAVHGYFARERQKARALRREMFPEREEHVKVGVFVDDLDEIHGVSTMYRQVQRVPSVGDDAEICLVRCGPDEVDHAISIPPIAELPIPLHDSRKLGVPSILDVLDLVARENFTILHVATPGPLGIEAVAAGLVFGLPIVGAYHTEFGRYAEILSGDALVGEIVEILVREFYERCSTVAVPSSATATDLRERGYKIPRIEVLQNGVDTALFQPGRRDEATRQRLAGDRTILLYVGRVSREKGLSELANGYRALRQRRDDVHLVVAGDGPYRAELEEKLGDTATFTGFVRGEELATIYASSDIFVFPSVTDTLGRAVVEAQASGLPAVVFDIGGPRECIRPDVTGLLVPHDRPDVPFFSRVAELVDDVEMRHRMGAAAGAFASTLSWENVRSGLVELYREVGTPSPTPAREMAHAAD